MKDTKELILKTAYNRFLYYNYEAVTINSIMQATGLTKGAIYHYFASKEEILKAVVDKYMWESRKMYSDEAKSLKELVQFNINFTKDRFLKLKSENPDLQDEIPINYLSFMVAVYRYYPDSRKIGKDFFDAQIGRWKKAIEKGIEIGELRSNIDMEATIATFNNIASGIVSNMIMRGSIELALDLYERQNWQLYKSIQNL